MQSSHVFTNVTGDIAGAEMSEAQVKRLKSIFLWNTHMCTLSKKFAHSFFCLCA